jgi:2,4-diaminopentanoate dehydrogenase
VPTSCARALSFTIPEHEPGARARIESACRQGGTTLHSTGISPGFITEAMPFLLTSIQRRLDCLTVEEFADMSSRNSPELIFGLMGFGRAPQRFNPAAMAKNKCDSFGGSVRAVADAFGVPLDDVTGTGAVAVAARTTEIAAGTVQAGTVAAMRFEVSGSHRGRAALRFRGFGTSPVTSTQRGSCTTRAGT